MNSTIRDEFDFLPKSKIKAGEGTEYGRFPFFTSSDVKVMRINAPLYNDEAVILGTGGKPSCNYFNGEFSVSTDNFVLSSKGRVLPKYLFYFLRTDSLSILDRGFKGAGLKHISKEYVQNIVLPLLPRTDQEVIIDELDTIVHCIESSKSQISLLDEQVKSLFNEMFLEESYRLEPLKKHIDLLAGYPFDGSGFTDEGIKICGGLIIMPDQIKWDECKCWPTKNGLDKYLLQEGDIVMAMDRPWINGGFKIGLIKSEDLPCLLIQRTARIRATDIDQTYLLACYKYGGFEQHTNVTGSTVPHISGKDIESFCVPLAPIAKQKRFAESANQIDKLRFI